MAKESRINALTLNKNTMTIVFLHNLVTPVATKTQPYCATI